MSFILNFIGHSIGIIFYIVFCWFPFMNKLKIKKQTLLIYGGIFFLVSISIMSYLYIPTLNLSEYGYYFSIFFFFTFVIMYFATINANKTQKLFVFFIVIYFCALSQYMYEFIGIYFGIRGMFEFEFELSDIFLIILTHICIMPFLYLFIKKLVIPILDENNTLSIWKYLWIIPAGFLTILFACFEFLREDMISNTSFMVLFITISIISPITYYLTTVMFIDTIRAMKLEKDMEIMQKQLEMQSKYYEELAQHIEDMRKAKHDFRHYLTVAASFIENGDKEGFSEFLKTHNQILALESIEKFCENYNVNVLCSYYSTLCNQNDIKTDFLLSISDNNSVLNRDYLVLFGNLLENAFEACIRINDKSNEKLFIRLRAGLISNRFGIIIQNSFNGNIKKQNNKYISSKRNTEEGIGLGTIKAVAKKYNGDVIIENDDTTFKISVILNL